MTITPFSQRDKRWASKNMAGIKGLTFEKFACLLCSIAMLDGRTPDILNDLFIKNDIFTDGYAVHTSTKSDDDLIDNVKAAKLLGFTHKYSKINLGVYPCIAETDHFKKLGYPKHFFIMIDGCHRVDPLDLNPIPEGNDYKIISWRSWIKNA